MTNWPNGDPQFNQILEAMLGSSSPELRRNLFYGVCIPVRFTLYAAVFLFRDVPYLSVFIGLIALITAIRLSGSVVDPGTQWWSKRWQFIISIVLFAVCVAVYFNKLDSRGMAVVLFISLFGGILESLMNH
jgi:hypothetical protein